MDEIYAWSHITRIAYQYCLDNNSILVKFKIFPMSNQVFLGGGFPNRLDILDDFLSRTDLLSASPSMYEQSTFKQL